jgi:hypothetical protein
MRTRTFKYDPGINASPLPCQLVNQRTWKVNRSVVFTSVLLWELVTRLGNVIIQIRHIGVFTQ